MTPSVHFLLINADVLGANVAEMGAGPSRHQGPKQSLTLSAQGKVQILSPLHSKDIGLRQMPGLGSGKDMGQETSR